MGDITGMPRVSRQVLMLLKVMMIRGRRGPSFVMRFLALFLRTVRSQIQGFLPEGLGEPAHADTGANLHVIL